MLEEQGGVVRCLHRYPTGGSSLLILQVQSRGSHAARIGTVQPGDGAASHPPPKAGMPPGLPTLAQFLSPSCPSSAQSCSCSSGVQLAHKQHRGALGWRCCHHQANSTSPNAGVPVGAPTLTLVTLGQPKRLELAQGCRWDCVLKHLKHKRPHRA